MNNVNPQLHKLPNVCNGLYILIKTSKPTSHEFKVINSLSNINLDEDPVVIKRVTTEDDRPVDRTVFKYSNYLDALTHANRIGAFVILENDFVDFATELRLEKLLKKAKESAKYLKVIDLYKTTAN